MDQQRSERGHLLAGVIGYPISHSRSPRLHGFWLKQYGIKGAYVPLEVRPELVKEALSAMRLLGFSGVNLTLPHKEIAYPLMDQVDELAQKVGAVNTVIFCENGMMEGRNTDVIGFTENLNRAGLSAFTNRKTATVLGAGGAARAIVVGIQQLGFEEIRLVNRNTRRAEQLAQDLSYSSRFEIFNWESAQQALKDSNLLVNATSLGMVGQADMNIDLTPLSEDAWVTDAVYAPLETSLIKQAKQKNRKTVDGLGMLLYQAKPGFSSWFGVDPEVTDELRSYVMEET